MTTQTVYVDHLQTTHLLGIVLVTIYKTCRAWLILTSQTLESGVINNPDKIDIMLFDSRRQGNLNFKFGQTDILSVDFHKHLGIVFSVDGKWTQHIDYILSKESKQVCVLRKLKFI